MAEEQRIIPTTARTIALAVTVLTVHRRGICRVSATLEALLG
jgi:hypothetical protein